MSHCNVARKYDTARRRIQKTKHGSYEYGGRIYRIHSMYICMYGHHIAEYGPTVYGCQSCSRSAEQGKLTFPCPRSRLRIWSRETGSAVPSRVTLPILHTQAESRAIYIRSIHYQ